MKKIIALGMMVIAIIIGTILIFTSNSAVAGIGPAGFAQIAQRAIIAENNQIYGSGSSPWRVHCTDKPTYVTTKLSDVVTCKITIKP